MTRIPNSMEICMLPEEPAVPASRWWEPPMPLAFTAALDHCRTLEFATARPRVWMSEEEENVLVWKKSMLPPLTFTKSLFFLLEL